MQHDLERRLDDLDDWKDALLGSLAIESAERLAFRPEGKGWCALDVVQHLVLVEEGVVGYARKKLQAPPQPVSLLDRAKLALLVVLMRSPIRVRAPLKLVIPDEALPLDVLSTRWEKVRVDLRELLVSLPEERRKALLFRHPVSGPLDPAGTLDFVEAHAKHHDAQFRRIWRAPGCPA
ncbi:MAG TPA: DinB family protein [Thermoanaerobaculia bacterium]|nr:DinB family protein [Thermoanaerobaculia bacterium]